MGLELSCGGIRIIALDGMSYLKIPAKVLPYKIEAVETEAVVGGVEGASDRRCTPVHALVFQFKSLECQAAVTAL
jgi:hypothetical protein